MASKFGYKTCATWPKRKFSKKNSKFILKQKNRPQRPKNDNFEKIFSK